MATFTQLTSGNWCVQVRRKTRYVAETFRRRKDGEEWAFDMERNIDRNGSSIRGWQREFDDPVPGMKTLRDAANYIMKLPKADQAKPHGKPRLRPC